MKLISTVVISLAFLSITAYSQQPLLPYKNPQVPIQERVNDLLGRMTPEEKFWQLFMIPGDLDHGQPDQYKHGIFGFQVSAASQTPGETQQLLQYNTSESGLMLLRKVNSIQKYFVEKTRLGIPIIAFDEALHGILREGGTSFPVSIALAATFDTTLMRQVSTAISKETRARGIRQVLSPVINIASDVRWGRVEETYGEDPFLTSAMGVAFVSPFEKRGIITTPKHLIANVGDGGRDSYPIHFNERFLEEIHFPPFKACIEQGGSRSVMTSYNSLDGTPCSMNDWMLNKKLKDEWDFKGFVISDASAVGGSIVLHNTALDFPESGKQAIEGGLDVIFQMAYEHHQLFIPPFLNGSIDQKKLDEAVARVLRAKFELGLFENPYVGENDIQALTQSKLHKTIARKAALESIVLLKNENSILPLQKSIKSLAVIGVDATEARLGGYSGPGNGKVSIFDGIKQLVKKCNVTYAPGCGRSDDTTTPIPAEFFSSDNKPGLKGSYFSNINLAGNPALERTDSQVDFHWTISSPANTMAKYFYSVRWTGKLRSPQTGNFEIGLEGNDGFRLFIDNKLMIDNWTKQTYRRITKKIAFEKGKQYDLRIEFFEPTGNAHIKLLWNVTSDTEAIEKKINEAVSLTKTADAVVVVGGITEGEFQDRAMLALPGRQQEMIKRIAATGKPVIVILIGGSAVTMTEWIDSVDGVLDAWYPGEEGGHAIAAVLFGDYNPSGRLPITFPIHEAQLPLVYNHKPTGRGDDYNNLTGLPLFPFGFGLSYTRFSYGDAQVSKSQIQATDSTVLTMKITNSGDRVGDEVVQLYIKDELASVARPVMELKGFKRINLLPGETKEVSFKITAKELMMLNQRMEHVVESGEFALMVGASSRDIRSITKLWVR